jgi:putative acetyltransferase
MTTRNLAIRPVRPDDVEALYEIRHQPLVIRYTSATPFERIGATRQFIEGLGPNDQLLVGEIDGRVVGMAGIHGRSGKQRHSASIGMAVHDAFTGRGLGRALLGSLLEIADQYLGLRRVDLEVLADNERALRLYEKVGFEREGVQRQAFFRDGQLIDLILMARLRPDSRPTAPLAP